MYIVRSGEARDKGGCGPVRQAASGVEVNRVVEYCSLLFASTKHVLSGTSFSHPACVLSVCLLVAVRQPTCLRLRRTFSHEQLKLPADTRNVCIEGMKVAASGDMLVLADYSNYTVKALHLSTGSVTQLFHECTSDWQLTSALLHGGASGDLRLLVPEWKISEEMRLVVCEREQPSGLYTHTYDISFRDDDETVFHLLIISNPVCSSYFLSAAFILHFISHICIEE